MTDYKRVVVTAPAGPQMRLANAFPADDYDPDSESESIELFADPQTVREFISAKGDHEGWSQWVEDIAVQEVTDVDSLPYKLRGLVDEGEARVWDYARDLIPDGADLDDYIWHGRVSCTWRESTFDDQRHAAPPTTGTLETWIADDYFSFDRSDANPTQNPDFDGGDGPVFDWAESLADDHPGAELRVTCDLRAPRTGAPHGYAYLDGLAVSMADGGALPDEVVEWCTRRFWAEFDEAADRYVGGEEYIGQADEFDVKTSSGREWVRLWWD